MSNTCVFSFWDHLQTTDVSFRDTGLTFRIAPPQGSFALFRAVDPNNETGFQNAEESFLGYESLNDIEKHTGIDGLTDMIRNASSKTAETFSNKLKTIPAGRMFNGTKRGVSSFTTPSDKTGIIAIHTSDYFTSAVMNTVCAALLNSGKINIRDIQKDMMDEKENKLAFLFNSLGANVSVLSREANGQSCYMLGMRPDRKTRHVAVNEGIDERESDGSTLHDLYARGMAEELGIHGHIAPATVREVFLVETIGQFGVHILAQTNLTKDEIMKTQKQAEDQWENSLLTAVPMDNTNQLLSYTKDDKPMVPWTRTLINNLVNGPKRITP